MGFKCGTVGLPNVGKSTLFNAITKSSIPAENFPFCTIEPNIGVVEVPDSRLDQLQNIIQSKKVIPASLNLVDIAYLHIHSMFSFLLNQSKQPLAKYLMCLLLFYLLL